MKLISTSLYFETPIFQVCLPIPPFNYSSLCMDSLGIKVCSCEPEEVSKSLDQRCRSDWLMPS